MRAVFKGALLGLCVGCGEIDELADGGTDEGRDAMTNTVTDAGADVPRDLGVDGGPADRFDATDARDASELRDLPDARDVSDASDVPDAAAVGIAPRGAISGERPAGDGPNAVMLTPAAEVVLRVDARPNEHVGFFFRFTPTDAGVVLQLDRWDGQRAVELGRTDAGRGLRTLAAFDPAGPRTFYARVRAGARVGLSGTLEVTRTPFSDGANCTSDCARLLQLPLAIDPAVDGYAATSSTVFRYQFGRRDLLMFLRHAGRTMARSAGAPFLPEDLSQWDGMTPGVDVGSPRHASHQRGKDVDLSLYGTDGRAPWRSYCTATNTGDGRECAAGSARGFDGTANARLFADWFATGRVTMCFLDRVLIPLLREGATRAGVDRALLPLFTDGTHVQHWPNHDNHVHIRVSEAMPGGIVFERWEAP